MKEDTTQEDITELSNDLREFIANHNKVHVYKQALLRLIATLPHTVTDNKGNPIVLPEEYCYEAFVHTDAGLKVAIVAPLGVVSQKYLDMGITDVSEGEEFVWDLEQLNDSPEEGGVENE